MTKVELLSNNYPHFINSALAATNEGGGHKFYEDTIRYKTQKPAGMEILSANPLPKEVWGHVLC